VNSDDFILTSLALLSYQFQEDPDNSTYVTGGVKLRF
jgi:hypothetical protein